jgi:hypothetical protein
VDAIAVSHFESRVETRATEESRWLVMGRALGNEGANRHAAAKVLVRERT